MNRCFGRTLGRAAVAAFVSLTITSATVQPATAREGHPTTEATEAIREPKAPTASPAPEGSETLAPKTDETPTLLKIRVTAQAFDQYRPWQKHEPVNRHGMGVVLSGNRILTIAEIVEDATHIVVQRPGRPKKVSANIVSVDLASNLAVIEPESAELLADIEPIRLSEDLQVGGAVAAAQLEPSGTLSLTPMSIDAVEIGVPGIEFPQLIYRVSGSLRFRNDSYTVPVLNNHTLVGFLVAYDPAGGDGICNSVTMIRRFLDRLDENAPPHPPIIGVLAEDSADENYRAYREIPTNLGGVFVTHVLPGSPADKAGLKKHDLLLKVGSYDIDDQGLVSDEKIGKLRWSFAITGNAEEGSQLPITVWRDGETLELEVIPTAYDPSLEVVPSIDGGGQPPFIQYAGLIFRELDVAYLEAWGKDWQTNAPQKLVYTYFYQHELFPARDRNVVVLSQMIPSEQAIGLPHRKLDIAVEQVNGQEIKTLADVSRALESPTDRFHRFRLAEDPWIIVVEAETGDQTTEMIAERYGISTSLGQ